MKTLTPLRAILGTNVLFFVGYIFVKATLVSYLAISFGKAQAYSVFGATFAASALIMLSYGMFSSKMGRPTTNALIGASISGGSLILNYFLPVEYITYSLSLFVSGSGIYVLASNQALNALFKKDSLRFRANCLYMLALNLGAFLSFNIIPSFKTSYSLLYLTGGCFILASTPFMYWLSKQDSNELFAGNILKLSRFILTATIGAATLIFFSHATPYIIFLFFTGSIAYLFAISHKERNIQYSIYALVLLGPGLIYWISHYILFAHLPSFLSSHVNDIQFSSHHMKALSLLSLDPLFFAIIGLLTLQGYRLFERKNTMQLVIGSIVIIIGVSCLIAGTIFTDPNNKVSPVWPLLALIAFPFAELIITATLSNEAYKLSGNTKHEGWVLASSKFVGAFAAEFYPLLMSIPFLSSVSTQQLDDISFDQHYFIYLAVIMLGIGLIYLFLKKTIVYVQKY